MAFDLEKLIRHLRVQSDAEDCFLGYPTPGRRKAVFGGQVVAQALSAASQATDAERVPHSIHAHFLLPGDISQPIQYRVNRVRDGGSFSLRQVTASQGSRVILLATVSLQKPEPGLWHQQPAPSMTPRSEMISEREFWCEVQLERPELHYLRPDNFTAMDILSRFRPGVFHPQPQAPRQSFWFRANGTLNAPIDHLLILAFQSDLQFLNTALHAHPYTITHPDVRAASLDHCLWFYGDVDVTEWVYYDMESPVSQGGRGLNHGYFYNEEGRLLASATQEGMIRVRPTE